MNEQSGVSLLHWIAWICLGLVFHSYILYPLSLPFLHRVQNWFKPAKKTKISPSNSSVTLILAAYNEEGVILEKLQNTLQLSSPSNHFEILIGSDGSNDKTVSLVESFIKQHEETHKFKLFDFSKRAGKAAVLNKLIQEAKGEILVFCDANTILLKNAIHKLLVPFIDPKVGGVCGKLILTDSSGHPLSHGESIYWKIESEIKQLEGKLGSLLGANGGLYAIRRSLFKPIPEKKLITDDFFITTEILRQGYQVVYEPLAIGREETSPDKMGEFRRKTRISQANFNYLPHFLKLLHIKFPLVSYCFFSHKLIRWFTPILLIILYILSAVCWKSNDAWKILFALQTSFYSFATIGWYLQKREKRKPFFLSIPYYFVAMNMALLIGFIKTFLVEGKGFWDTEKRQQSRS